MIKCILGIHYPAMSRTWYYEPDWACKVCEKPNVYPLRARYILWASFHTMNPFAWPWVIYERLRYGPK